MANSLDADGLLQRFLPVWGDGERRPDLDRAPDEAAMQRYESAIRQLANAAFLAPEPIKLSDAAHAVWSQVTGRIRNLAGLPGVSDAWAGHLGKWDGFAARLLLVCHVLSNLGDGLAGVDQTPVSGATARQAAKLVDWLLSNSLRFYTECIGAGEAGDDAKWIAGWILSGNRTGKVTRRDIGQDRRELRDRPDRIVRAMRILEASDWCQSSDERADRDGPTRWTICPEVHDGRFADRANSERQRRERERVRIALAVRERSRIQGDLVDED